MIRSYRSLVAPACVMCLTLIATLVSADNWTRFRGPNGVGVVEDQNIPVKFTNDNILWKIELPGEGHSSPVVWGDLLFTQTASDDVTQRQLICVDVKAGKVLWTSAVKGSAVKKHKKNSFASSTPAVDGERVYVSFWDGRDIYLNAYDFEGNEVWSRNLGPFKSQHGAGQSPIVYKDKVILVNHQDYVSILYAMDAKTGELVWQTARPANRACYAAPFFWSRADGAKEMVVTSSLQFTGYNPENGKVNWNWEWTQNTPKKPLRITGSPVYWKNMIFASSGDGGGDRLMAAIKVNGDGKNGAARLVWSKKSEVPYVPTMLVYLDHIYFVNDYGVAACYEAKTGKTVWSERISEVPFTASPVIIDGKIYAVDEAGDVFVLAASPNFHVYERNSLGERVRATPAVANSRLYIRGKDHLFCIGN